LPQLAAAVSAAGKTAKRRRLPANYDPEVAPDPERWLPRHERTAYKKRRMNKRQKEREIGKGTQGASSSASGAGGGGAATM
jgi:signal recognition particle subunit SRP72